MIQGMNHFTVLTDDLDRTLALLRRRPRPARPVRDPTFDFPGAWLYAGDTSRSCTSSPAARCRHRAPACSITWRSRRTT